jgi:hypothetical protein
MFIINWLFDKLGYMPKINTEVGVVNQAWPFPVPQQKKPVLKKATTRTTKKPAVVAKTARKPKTK